MINSVPWHHHLSFVVCCVWTTLSKSNQNHRRRKHTEGTPKHKIGSAPRHGTMICLVCHIWAPLTTSMQITELERNQRQPPNKNRSVPRHDTMSFLVFRIWTALSEYKSKSYIDVRRTRKETQHIKSASRHDILRFLVSLV